MREALPVIAIDPGPTHSAFAILWTFPNGQMKFGDRGKERNEDLRGRLFNAPDFFAHVVIEMIASYGMPVGAEVFETCVWIGRFVELAGDDIVLRIARLEVKQHLCHDSRAKDANIRAALIDRFGGKAAIRKGGALYKVSGDQWAALALAVTYWDTHHERKTS